MKLSIAVLVAIAVPVAALAQTPFTPDEQSQATDVELNEALQTAHQTQNQLLRTDAMLAVVRKELADAQVKAKHAGEMDAWWKSGFKGFTPFPEPPKPTEKPASK